MGQTEEAPQQTIPVGLLDRVRRLEAAQQDMRHALDAQTHALTRFTRQGERVVDALGAVERSIARTGQSRAINWKLIMLVLMIDVTILTVQYTSNLDRTHRIPAVWLFWVMWGMLATVAATAVGVILKYRDR